VSEILNAANVPKGSFYHDFGSKEDFAAAALERYIAREAQHSATVLNDSKTTPLKRLKRYFSDLIKVAGQSGPIPGCMMGRFTLEIAAESAQLRRRISTAFAHWQRVIARSSSRQSRRSNFPQTRILSRWRVSCSTVGRGALTFAS
jgi:TetR/AcrR family transcriptional repressor of nem operon